MRSRKEKNVQKSFCHVKKKLVGPVLLALLLSVGTIGGTAAWLVTHTDSITNTFTPSTVTSEITETVDKGTKSNVSIKNTGDVPAYVRCTLVFSWVDENGVIAGTVPVEDTDYIIDYADNGSWFKGTDGFWYCRTAVPEGANSPILIETCTLTDPAMAKTDINGKPLSFRLQVIASAIQAEPDKAVESAWPAVKVAEVNETKQLQSHSQGS